MKHQSIKNLFIAGLTLLSFGFLSAQFPIPSGIDNALQVIQRVLVTTNGMFSGSVVMDTNTGANNIYINPLFLSTTTPYSWQYLLTLNQSGFISITTWNNSISGAIVSGNNLIVTLTDWSILDLGSVVWPQGPTGPQGSQWPQGTQGNIWPQGPQWPAWPQGATGATWATGATGATWSIGPQWPTWPQGATGATGPQGPTWPAGQDGIGVPQNLSLNLTNLGIDGWSGVDLAASFWSLFGNNMTNPTQHFLGTTDNQDLVFRTNDMEVARLTTNWFMGIWTNNPLYALDVTWGMLTRDSFLSWAKEVDLGFFFGGDASALAQIPIPGLSISLSGTLWYLDIFGIDLGAMWFDNNYNHMRYDIEIWHRSWWYETSARSSMASKDVDWSRINLSTIQNRGEDIGAWQCIAYSTDAWQCASIWLFFNNGYCEWFHNVINNESACNQAANPNLQTYRSNLRAEWWTSLDMQIDTTTNTNHIFMESFSRKWGYPCFNSVEICSWAQTNTTMRITPTGIWINRWEPQYTLDVAWSIKADNYHSANNNTGIWSTVSVGSCQLIFENGLLISNSC
jgi:hypothetical protein